MAHSQALQQELARRESQGLLPMTIKAIEQDLRKLGYRLDRRMDCRAPTVYLSGPNAGCSYPCITTDIVEMNSGLSFANVNARRDENFRKLQEIRLKDSHFAVIKGAIFCI